MKKRIEKKLHVVKPVSEFEATYKPTQLHTPFDTPLDTLSNEGAETLCGLLQAARLMRERAHKLRDRVDFAGTSGATEDDMEFLLERAVGLDSYADRLLDLWRRECRRHWIAMHPREEEQPRKAARRG